MHHQKPLSLLNILCWGLLAIACGEGSEPGGTPSPANWGYGGSGATPVGGQGGGYGGGSGGGGGGVDTREPALRCNVDSDCPAEESYCAVSSYCVACLNDSHCDDGTVCTNGLCLSEQCDPGMKACSGITLMTCNASGAGWSSFSCPGESAGCSNGTCTGCDPWYGQCVGKHERLVCLQDGSALVHESCGADGFCVDGACMDCYPGMKQCGGGWVQSCNANGKWEDIEDCGATQSQCSNGMCQSACGQSGKLSNEGCDYWAVDMDNEGPAADSPYAVIVSNLNAYAVTVTISSKSSAQATPLTVAQGKVEPGGLEVFQLPQQNMGQTGLYWKALRLQSTGPIVAYQFNPLDNVGVFSNDASLLLPSNTFGKEYIVVSREEIPASGLESYRGSIAIVAASEQTQVKITPSAPTMGGNGLEQLEKGQSATVILEPYQVLNIQSDMLGADLTGTVITADKPIGVFGGHEAAVGSEQCCADHLEQQLFPVSTWGKTYVATKSKARGVEKDYWRLVAATDGTSVTVSPSLSGVLNPISLNRGEFYEFQTDKDFVIDSSKPIMVAQTLPSSQEIAGPPTCLTNSDCAKGYSCSFISPDCMIDSPYCDTSADCPSAHSCACGDLGFCSCEPIGDPALILAAPVEQYKKTFVFLTPTNYLADYVNIVAPSGATVTLDGTQLSAASFTPVGNSYKVARISVSDGVHRVEASHPVGVIAYGYDDDVSYGYPAGLALSVQP